MRNSLLLFLNSLFAYLSAFVKDESGAIGADGKDDSKEDSDGGAEDTSASGEKDSVSFKSYSKVLSEVKKQKAANAEMQKQLNEIKAQKEADENVKLAEQNKYKELYEKSEKEKTESQKQFSDLSGKLNDTRKLQAFQEVLPGKLKSREYMVHVKKDAIKFDADGKVDMESVQTEVSRFVKEHGSLLESSEDLDPVNPQNKRKSSLTYDSWRNLPPKERKARRQEIVNIENKVN